MKEPALVQDEPQHSSPNLTITSSTDQTQQTWMAERSWADRIFFPELLGPETCFFGSSCVQDKGQVFGLANASESNWFIG